jgi:hypothetical protein
MADDRIRSGKLTELDREIAQTLVDTGAINFEAIGAVIGKVGSRGIAMDDDGWIRWCASDMRIYKWPRPRLELEDLAVLREVARELPGRG